MNHDEIAGHPIFAALVAEAKSGSPFGMDVCAAIDSGDMGRLRGLMHELNDAMLSRAMARKEEIISRVYNNLRGA